MVFDDDICIISQTIVIDTVSKIVLALFDQCIYCIEYLQFLGLENKRVVSYLTFD